MDSAQKSKLLHLPLWVDGYKGGEQGVEGECFIAAQIRGKDVQPSHELSYLQNIVAIQLPVSVKILSEAGSCWQLCGYPQNYKIYLPGSQIWKDLKYLKDRGPLSLKYCLEGMRTGLLSHKEKLVTKCTSQLSALTKYPRQSTTKKEVLNHRWLVLDLW